MDIGIGFKKSLAERFSFKNDIEAIEKRCFTVHQDMRMKAEGTALLLFGDL